MSLASNMFMRSRTRRILRIFIALIFVPISGFSDRILLTNGRSIDGVIVKETATGLVLDIGGGTTTIASNRIAKIQRTDETGNEQLSRQWREQNFLHEKSVPEGMEKVAAECRALLDVRDQAVYAHQSIAALQDQEAALLVEIENISKSLAEANMKMADAKLHDSDVEAYNALVVEVNSIGAKQNIKNRELNDVRKNRKTTDERISDYVQTLLSFEQSFADRTPLLQQKFDTDDTRSFLRKVSLKLDALNQEFRSSTIQTGFAQNGSRMISALINDKISGRFILDTGATTVSLSKSFAQRLHLDTSSAKATEITMANGSKVKVESVILTSVQAGDARAENVEAVVIATPANNDVDGLLGMSFLSKFVVQFDGNSGRLTLSKFNPK